MSASPVSRIRPALLIAMRWAGPLTLDQGEEVCLPLVSKRRGLRSRVRDVFNTLRSDGIATKDGDRYRIR